MKKTLPITVKELHKQKHAELHSALQELFADYITNTEGRTTDTILDLIAWSAEQKLEPDHSYEA